MRGSDWAVVMLHALCCGGVLLVLAVLALAPGLTSLLLTYWWVIGLLVLLAAVGLGLGFRRRFAGGRRPSGTAAVGWPNGEARHQ